METARMGSVNASVRFVGELVALYGVGAGVWVSTGSIVTTVSLPVVSATIWGVFRVPDDPGPAPVAVPGPIRLGIEAALFGGGALGLWASHGVWPGAVFAMIIVVHYATTPERFRYVWSCREWGSDSPSSSR